MFGTHTCRYTMCNRYNAGEVKLRAFIALETTLYVLILLTQHNCTYAKVIFCVYGIYLYEHIFYEIFYRLLLNKLSSQ